MIELIYIAHAVASAGRAGHVETDDGALQLTLAAPGTAAPEDATNPEQLFACAYAACFCSALEAAAQRKGIRLLDHKVRADISLNKGPDGFMLGAELHATLPGVPDSVAQDLMGAAHALCPYSKALRGNVEITSKVSDGGAERNAAAVSHIGQAPTPNIA